MKLLVNPYHDNDLNDASNWRLYICTFYVISSVLIIAHYLTLRSIQQGSKQRFA